MLHVFFKIGLVVLKHLVTHAWFLEINFSITCACGCLPPGELITILIK